jgi:hypothetical protein
MAWSPDSQRLMVVQTNRVFDAQGQLQRPSRPTQLWQVDVGTEEPGLSQLVFSASVQNEEGIVLGTWVA